MNKTNPDFFTMPIEQVNQYLRDHGYDPEAVGLRGEILAGALLENLALRERAEKAEAILRGMFPMWTASMAFCEHGRAADLIRMENYYSGKDNPLTSEQLKALFEIQQATGEK
jgi:endonuclease III-like uncharacterized protein